MNPKIYLASPLGFSEVGQEFMYSKIIPMLKECGFDVLDPWTLTDSSIISSVLSLPYGNLKKTKWADVNKIIGKNNQDAIKSCDIVFAVLDGVDVDSGTSSEIGYASALGKTVIGYRGDFRLASDNEGSIVNLQVEYFIYLNNGKIHLNLDDAKTHLLNIRKAF